MTSRGGSRTRGSIPKATVRAGALQYLEVSSRRSCLAYLPVDRTARRLCPSQQANVPLLGRYQTRMPVPGAALGARTLEEVKPTELCRVGAHARRSAQTAFEAAGQMGRGGVGRQSFGAGWPISPSVSPAPRNRYWLSSTKPTMYEMMSTFPIRGFFMAARLLE